MTTPDWKNQIDAIWSKCESGETQKLTQIWLQTPRTTNTICPSFDDFIKAYGLKPSLAHVFLSQFITPRSIHILMSGGHLDQFLGTDLAGEDMFLQMPSHIANQERPFYNDLRLTPCAGRVIRVGTHTSGETCKYSTIQLPLADLDGKIRFIVGTGQFLAPVPQKDTSGHIVFDSIKYVELQYFDIGAGTPNVGSYDRSGHNLQWDGNKSLN